MEHTREALRRILETQRAAARHSCTDELLDLIGRTERLLQALDQVGG